MPVLLSNSVCTNEFCSWFFLIFLSFLPNVYMHVYDIVLIQSIHISTSDCMRTFNCTLSNVHAMHYKYQQLLSIIFLLRFSLTPLCVMHYKSGSIVSTGINNPAAARPDRPIRCLIRWFLDRCLQSSNEMSSFFSSQWRNPPPPSLPHLLSRSPLLCADWLPPAWSYGRCSVGYVFKLTDVILTETWSHLWQ